MRITNEKEFYSLNEVKDLLLAQEDEKNVLRNKIIKLEKAIGLLLGLMKNN